MLQRYSFFLIQPHIFMVFYFFICVLSKFKSVLLILLVLFILFKPSIFVPVMLFTCAQLERDNSITFRLQSGRKQYIAKGGKLGRKPGSKKSADQKKEEYREAISFLKKGYATRDVAKLTGKGISTIQRLKKEFC